jgi:acetolactate synthase-1/2/3 large subunit
MPSDANTARYSAANFFLEALSEVGIDYLFSNFGTDHAPLIEAAAGRRQRGQALPKIILCPHESTAGHMAGGYALATGRGQGVLVHVDVGTANTAIAMHNLFRSRIPVFLMAGKAPFTTHGEIAGSRDNYVHFVQEPFDQGSLVRPYVKWEWTLPSGVVAKETVRRAHTIMQSEPKGPVYLMLPRETLSEMWDEQDIHAFPADRFGATTPSGADPALVDALVEKLLTARHPILITSFGGRTPGTSEAIEALAAFAGIRVFESNMVNAIAHEGPCFSGFQPAAHMKQADLGLLVDSDVPWIPKDATANEQLFWAQIDLDVLKANSPMWSFPAHLRLNGNSARILAQVLEVLEARATPAFRKAAAERLQTIAQERAKRLDSVAKLADNKGRPGEINAHYLCREIGKRIGPEDFIMQEAARNGPAMAQQIPRPIAGSMVRVAGGGLGASGGMALGVKLARPEHLSVQILGDGGFYLNNPSSVYAVSKQYGLPIFTIVLDNSGWSAVKESTLRMYPDGDAKGLQSYGAELAPDVDFSKVIEGFGGYGEKLTDPEQVEAAIDRCLREVRGGRSALLHACVTRL